jgi:hypothetical protein
MHIIKTVALGAVVGLGLASAAQAVVPMTVSVESQDPAAQTTTSTFTYVGLENFDKSKKGASKDLETKFGSGSAFAGKYYNPLIRGQDSQGGAGASGNYAVVTAGKDYSLSIDAESKTGGANYFGLWMSSIDAGNTITFFKGGKQVFAYTGAEVKTLIDGLKTGSQFYCSPVGGKTCDQPNAFVNFYGAEGVTFDKIIFGQTPGAGVFGSDNHTIGRWKTQSGSFVPDALADVGAVPEPQAWAMLLAGFGMVGMNMRRRNRAVAA